MKTNKEFWDNFFSKKRHSDEELNEAYIRSSNWCNCAVGTKFFPDLTHYDPLISKKINDSIPFTYKTLGSGFTFYIKVRDLKEAKKIYNEIQNLILVI